MDRNTFIEILKTLPIDKVTSFYMQYTDFNANADGEIKTIDFKIE